MKTKYIKEVKQKVFLALKKIRKDKLEQGHPFMINSAELPIGQCYLEFPDGRIQVFTICPIHNDFKLVRELTPKEYASIREKILLIS